MPLSTGTLLKSTALLVLCVCIAGSRTEITLAIPPTETAAPLANLPASQMVKLPARGALACRLEAGDAVELSASFPRPSEIPANARVRVSWELVKADNPALIPRAPDESAKPGRELHAFDISAIPSPNWSKLLHALDADVFQIYRAPVSGTYRFKVVPETDEVDLFEKNRWRENGTAPASAAIPAQVGWPNDAQTEISLKVAPVDLSGDAPLFVELEPNDTPEQAQLIPLTSKAADDIRFVVGSSDDIEFFDNGDVGRAGEDWFRLEFSGQAPRLLAACLSIPDQQVAAQIRCYSVDPKSAEVHPGTLLPIQEYTEGRNPNERTHQQSEQHRIAINRLLQPGGVYFLRVEANAPVYELQLKVVQPAPFEDPRQAVRHALYDHIGQVEAWLANRPRGASVERRIRDTGNLLGTNCMSCHTQSGVWGPAIPFELGYRPENAQLWRELVNLSYQSMRPTNQLIDAANNTSLAPLDLGDGPAGTRVTGHAVVSYERFQKPRKLQSKQAIRAANFVLQSGDPGGINAAGPGANVGQGVVFNYAGEILWEAWKATDNPNYFHALVEKGVKMLSVEPKFTDDVCHRIELFSRYFPEDLVAEAARVAKLNPKPEFRVPFKGKVLSADEIADLAKKIPVQVKQDVERLRGIQNADGSWHFNPGSTPDQGKTWVAGTTDKDPSPTAQALVALEAAGLGTDDPTVAKGVKSLLAQQHPTGYWNAASQTGFVTTSYALHALARLYPAEAPKWQDNAFQTPQKETLRETLNRVRRLSMTEDPRFVKEMQAATKHPHPYVRHWGYIGLGSIHTDAGVPNLVNGLSDPERPARAAAVWGMRQTLIDDRGWDALFAALQNGDDRTREAVLQTLVMKVDGVMPESNVGWDRLTAAFDHAMNHDRHPGVRAWAAKAAWPWWIFNPPVRKALNESWITLLSREEPNLLVENCQRYQTQALFIANGHKANGSRDHQYEELGELLLDLDGVLAEARDKDPVLEARLSRRLVAVAATFHQQSGGDGGPGQMGYVTPGSGELFGAAVMSYFKRTAKEPANPVELATLKIGLEGAANIPFQPLQEKLIDYSLHGPEDLRSLAASSVSDPRSVQLVAVPELIEPLMQQIHRGANEPPRRAQLSDPLLNLFGRVRWVIPQTLEQQRELFGLLIPKFDVYYPQTEIDAVQDAVEKAKMTHRRDADWYLASGIGNALGENPDLHFDTTFEFFPQEFDNPLKSRFWLPSVNWIITYKTQLPEVSVKKGDLPPIDPFEEPRSRAMRLFLSQLDAQADPRSRELAVTMANATALRRNPEVLTALEELLEFEKREPVIKTAKNILSTNRDSFMKDLTAATKSEKPLRVKLDGNGNPELSPEFVEDFAYFRDYVIPEMNRVLRGDQRSCMACHGVPGRVPPLELHRPDDAGFLTVDKLLANYRLLADRVDAKDVEKSKLLRKPLNVQTGEEDGHQGGRRYQPDDPGYLILRKWALNQVKLSQPESTTASSTAGEK